MDHVTDLQWKDNSVAPQLSWVEALNYCTALILDGRSDWYLPTRKELVSITDKSRVNPAIDPEFVNVTSSYYWSSTTLAFDTGVAWHVNFRNGNDVWNYKTNRYYVRCVRDGQIAPLTFLLTPAVMYYLIQ